MEVLAGSRGDDHLRSLRGMLARATTLATGPADFETAASLCRSCRQAGGTVHKLIDCLIGAVAIRDGVPILHADADFDMLARHTGLGVHSVEL